MRIDKINYKAGAKKLFREIGYGELFFLDNELHVKSFCSHGLLKDFGVELYIGYIVPIARRTTVHETVEVKL